MVRQRTKGQTLVEQTLERPLRSNETLEFKVKNLARCELSNITLHSKTATARELWLINGPPILGYSHCLCGCGQSLGDPNSEEFRTKNPQAFFQDHGPLPVDREKLKRLNMEVGNPEQQKKTHEAAETFGQKPGKPRGRQGGRKRKALGPKGDVAKIAKNLAATMGPTTDLLEDPLENYRPLFEKLIHNLPWTEFKMILFFLNEGSVTHGQDNEKRNV